MCGISGILSFNIQSKLSVNLKKMTDAIQHRGPDGEGHWLNEEQNVGLGHRRLSIIDLSEKASQPMISKDNRYVITFNGEIYNYLELKKELEVLGYHFFSNSDTEVLLVGYQHQGESFLSKIEGMFSFAIWDNLKKELFCARDRFGEKPFYFYNDKSQFIFASEMKSIFRTGVAKEINNEMLFLYLSYDTVENPNNKRQTFYQNIQQLPAAHSLKINQKGHLDIKRYWSLDIKNQIDYPKKEAKELFLQLFDESLTHRMRSDVKVGSSLSGGVDSSSIVCSIANLFPSVEFDTFTARFSDPNLDEGIFIKELQNRYNFNSHQCFPESNQMIDLIDKVFYHQEEPFGSSSILAQWEVMKLARENSTIVLLDGQGADETIAGYFKYFSPFLHEIKKTKSYKKQKIAIENHLEIKNYLTKKEQIRMLLPQCFDFISDLLRPYLSFANSNLNKEFRNEYKHLVPPFHRDTNLNAFLYNDLFKYGLGKLLRFSDRNAMAHSVEVRLPYLSHKLVEFVFSLTSHFKINNAWTKSILRESMKERVPHKILYRKDKKGFQAPSSWMNTPKIEELTKDSIQLLIREGILKTPNSQDNWKYIMSAKLFSNSLV